MGQKALKEEMQTDVVEHAYNPSIWETEAGVSLWVQDQPE